MFYNISFLFYIITKYKNISIMKVKQQTANKIGLFSSIMVIFGAVVGIGIFFKNVGVFKANNNNWLGVLLSWVFAIVMAMCMAISFAEAGSCKLKIKSDGLGGWASLYCGHKFGRYTKISHSLNYFPILIAAIAIFAGEACLNCFGTPGAINFGKLTTLYVFLIGLAFLALFVVLNLIATKAMGKFNTVAGIIKFIPLIAVILLGIIFGILNAKGGIWPHSGYTPGKFSITGVIGSIPAILFAFEGYTVIGSIAGDMKNPEKNVPLAIVLAMIIISVLNLAITIGCMTAGVGNVYDLMDVVFGAGTKLAKIFSIIMSVFIFICIIGVLNALIFSGMRGLQTNCANSTLFKGKALVDKKPNNELFAGAIYLLIIAGFWLIGLAIPSSILNSDAIADGSTNVLIIYFYILYAIILLGSFRNRFSKKVEVNKIKVFPVTCVIGILCCLFIFAFTGIYQSLINPILSPNNFDFSWGLFVSGDSVTKFANWQIAIIFWVLFATMSLLPLLNDGLIARFEKTNKNLLIWQNDKVAVKTITGAKVTVAKPIKVEKVIAKQPKPKKEHPYKAIAIALPVTLVSVALITMGLTLAAR